MLIQQALKELAETLGQDKITTKPAELACYSFDATAGMPVKTPAVVVTPTCTEEVVQVINIARKYKIPVYPRGAGTNISGGTVPLHGGLVLSLLKMAKILEVDAENLVAVVQSGVIIQELDNAVAPAGLIYPPDPGSVATATMGGSVAECSGGLRGLKYGVTKHYIMGLEVVLADGQVLKIGGKTVKNVTGYDLVKLFTGSEGTLGIITEITVRLIPAPEARATMMATFERLADAGNAIQEIIKNKVIPATMEIMDQMSVQVIENFAKVGLPTGKQAVLLIEVDGIPAVVEQEAEIVIKTVQQNNGSIKKAKDEREREALWTARRAAFPALAQLKPTIIIEDATVPRSEITTMLIAINEIAQKHNVTICTLGHAGDGNLHPAILTDTKDKEEMVRVHQAMDEIFKKALELGGTLTGEHGIGLAKSRYLPWEMGDAGMDVMKRIKKALDPEGLLNPGKMFPD